MSTVTLHLGDCLEYMRTIPDGSVDAIIADLPYGTTACAWDVVIPFEPLWVEYKRIIKPRGAVVLFGSQPFTSLLVTSNLEWFKYCWVWRKNEGSNFVNSKYAPIKYHEDIAVFGNGRTAYNPQPTIRESEGSRKAMRNPIGQGKALRAHGTLKNIGPVQYDPFVKTPESVLEIKCVPNGGGGKQHPTQKPVALLEYLVRTYTNPGDTVLDNTMGSGTTGVACVRTGRHFVGCEIDPVHFATAQRRIAEAQLQPPLFPHEATAQATQTAIDF